MAHALLRAASALLPTPGLCAAKPGIETSLDAANTSVRATRLQRGPRSQRHPYVTHYTAIVILTISSLAAAECPYPCWSEVNSDKFTYESFETMPQPPVSSAYEFSLPFPSQPKGAMSDSCNAQENPKVDLYHYNSQNQTWSGPLTGPIYRYPTYLELSQLTSGWKGIAVHVLYQGKLDSSTGHTLVESVFFHDERCYRASAEFGFSHYMKGLPGDDKIFFYYEINANCGPAGKCRVHGTQEILTDQRVNVPIAIPSQPNSHGGSDWLYEAYLIEGGTKFHVRVVDPYKHETKGAPLNVNVQDFFRDIAAGYAAQGGEGYVTATATRDGPLADSSDPPVMNIFKIYAAK